MHGEPIEDMLQSYWRYDYQQTALSAVYQQVHTLQRAELSINDCFLKELDPSLHFRIQAGVVSYLLASYGPCWTLPDGHSYGNQTDPSNGRCNPELAKTKFHFLMWFSTYFIYNDLVL